MRRALFLLAPFLLVPALTLPGAAQEGTRAVGIAMHGAPAHGAEDTHLAYANPEAPKGGTLHRSIVGTFDSLNPHILLGTPAAGITEYAIPTLLARSWNEPFTMYGYVAETLEVPEDRTWIIFHLHPDAVWNDGVPITLDDVEFSYEMHLEHGSAGRRRALGRVKSVTRVGDRAIRFDFVEGIDREQALLMGLMPVLPKHYYSSHPFNETSLDIPVTGGPYRIASVDPGRSITFERVADWWGEETLFFNGQMNFDTLRFDYYRDSAVDLEAFRAHEVGYRLEFNSERWASGYDFPAVADGEVTLLETRHGRPDGMRAMGFNTRRPVFADPEVRRALVHAFDFEWINENYLRGLANRTDSFFENSEMAASGLPEGAELALLEPWRDQLPGEVFDQVYTLPATDGSGNNRAGLRRAGEILEAAGWSVEDGRRVQAKTGTELTFEILLSSQSNERIALVFAEALKRLGITAEVRLVDTAEYTARREEFDFDMVFHRWRVSLSPGTEQLLYWGMEAAETPGTRNYTGVSHPAIDGLADATASARTRAELVTATRALDRVLLWQHVVLPLYYYDMDRIAYWGELGYVEDPVPLYGLIATVNAWWQP